MASPAAANATGRILNVNIGILGHVDSGKTSLSRALSTHLSTAALDKSPQSQERGITLDLGFSALQCAVPPHLQGSGYDEIQFTLVDCPGHASLIRTIIGGAQIIDAMVLVIDVTKGIQTQTAECLVIGEILCEKLIVCLNKMDKITGSAEEAASKIEKAKKKLRAVFAQTKFGADVLMVCTAANPGGAETYRTGDSSQAAAADETDTKHKTPAKAAKQQSPNKTTSSAAAHKNAASITSKSNAPAAAAAAPAIQDTDQAFDAPVADPAESAAVATAAAVPTTSHTSSGVPNANVKELVDVLLSPAVLAVPERKDVDKPFLFAIDHCFRIRGQGTVMTGTMLRGRVQVGNTLEIPSLKTERKIKSMQMFHRPVQAAMQGDRVGICVPELDPRLLERGVACEPGSLGDYTAVIAQVDKIRFFKSPCKTKERFHISIGHATVMATAHFFGIETASAASVLTPSDDGKNDEDAPRSSSGTASAQPMRLPPANAAFDWTREYAHLDELHPISAAHPAQSQFCVLEFDKTVTCPPASVLLGSRFDSDIHLNTCRLAFAGRLLCGIDFTNAAEREKLRVYKRKERSGVVDRVVDDHSLIGRDLLKKDADINRYIGMRVVLSVNGRAGRIEGSFGTAGKFKVYFPDGIGVDETALTAPAGAADATAVDVPPESKSIATGKRGKGAGKHSIRSRLILKFKKYVFALDKKVLVQDAAKK